MKKLFAFVITIGVVNLACAQTGSKPATKPATRPATTTPAVLKTLNDSVSYVIGMSAATFYKQQGITKLNSALVTRGINDVFGGKKLLVDDMAANSVMNKYMMEIQKQKSKGAIDSGAAFLKQNKNKPGVKTTESGLQYEVVTEGTGARPTAEDSVTCHYSGKLLNGFEFDNSYNRGQPVTFALKGVIPGWTEGLQLMTVGSKYKFYVPYTLGYGAMDYGPIPGGSTLTFEVELLDVKKKQ